MQRIIEILSKQTFGGKNDSAEHSKQTKQERDKQKFPAKKTFGGKRSVLFEQLYEPLPESLVPDLVNEEVPQVVVHVDDVEDELQQRLLAAVEVEEAAVETRGFGVTPVRDKVELVGDVGQVADGVHHEHEKQSLGGFGHDL